MSKALLPLNERTNQPTNQAHGNRTKQHTTTAANLGSPPPETETPDLPLFQLFSLSFLASKHLAPVYTTAASYESWGLVFSALLTTTLAHSCCCNQKGLGQILGPKPKPGKQAHSKGPLSLLLSLLARFRSQFTSPGNLGIHTVYCMNRVTPPVATLFYPFFSSASWLSLASPPRAPSRANSTPLFDLVTSSSSLHLPNPD